MEVDGMDPFVRMTLNHPNTTAGGELHVTMLIRRSVMHIPQDP